MFINFGFEEVNIENYKVELKIGNEIKIQKLTAPSDMAQMQFKQLLKNTMQSQEPVRISISQEEQVWNQYRKEWKVIENKIQFANKTYMENYPEEFKEDC